MPNANIVFGGSGASRTVTVTPAANQNGSANITVTVTDADTGTATTTFLLTVNSANDIPTISAITAQIINEDANTGALAFTVGDVETAAVSLTVSGPLGSNTLTRTGYIVVTNAAPSASAAISVATRCASM